MSVIATRDILLRVTIEATCRTDQTLADTSQLAFIGLGCNAVTAHFFLIPEGIFIVVRSAWLNQNDPPVSEKLVRLAKDIETVNGRASSVYDVACTSLPVGFE